jgi:hypothetical protein
MKFKLSPKAILSITIISSSFVTIDLLAGDCSKSDIDYYLEKGFSHSEVVKLCETPSNRIAAPAPTAAMAPVSNQVNSSFANSQYSKVRDDQIYLEAILNASNIRLAPPTLSYRAEECVEYGEQTLAGQYDKACVQSNITVNLNGLKVIKATKRVFLIRDTKLIVEGDIQREYLNIDSLNSQKQNVIRLKLPNNPRQLNLPVQNGIDPKQVVKRLEKHIT